MDWMYAIFTLAISILIMFMVLSSRTQEVSIRYRLVHSDTSYTSTSTRGDGMTIINYYDKEKK